MTRSLIVLITLAGLELARAAVPAEEALRLKGPLTPLGAERAGNAAGTIPAWGGTGPAPGEKPLYSITAANLPAFAALLPEGQKVLLAKFADYRLDVYPSHRTAALPQAVYDATFANATRARSLGNGVAAAAGGIPFPIPRTGMEVVWNHLLAFWGPAREDRIRNYYVAPDGSLSLTNQFRETVDFPYYYPGATADSFGGYYFKRREASDDPPSLAGRGYLQWQPIDPDHSPVLAWQYLPRERRVRKSPLLSHDTPTPDGAGLMSFDDYYLFSGSPDHYRFTLLGKREMIVPYNNDRFVTLPAGQVAGPRHADPASLRYELHRVWVVDAVLAEGKRHMVPHRRLYMDEDSWFAVYSDGWDGDGRLWKFSQGTMIRVPELPATVIGPQFIYDLQSGGYILAFSLDGTALRPTAPHDPAAFMPESLGAQGIR